MKTNHIANTKAPRRCAIYTRKSSEEGLEQSFNTLDAQRLAAENYIASQQHEGWVLLPQHYDDGGYSGGNMERPGLKHLFADIRDNQIDCIVVYKIDRLTRSLLDFARIIMLFEEHNVSFVSVTESFNTSTSMGRLMLNILLSFAQYERELAGERIRDKVAASKQKGYWMGGTPPLGYEVKDKQLVINEQEAKTIRLLYERFLQTHSISALLHDLNDLDLTSRRWQTKQGNIHGGHRLSKKGVQRILQNPTYMGKVQHKGNIYPGQHTGIIQEETWQQVQSVFQQRERPRTSGVRLNETPLLKGLLRCGECGTNLLPTYTSRQHKRYCYYICADKQNGRQAHCAIGRLSAGEIEAIVINQITKLLRQPEMVAKAIEAANEQLAEPEVIKALQSIESVWAELFPAQRARIAHLLIQSVVVTTTGVEINLYKRGFSTLTEALGRNAA